MSARQSLAPTADPTGRFFSLPGLDVGVTAPHAPPPSTSSPSAPPRPVSGAVRPQGLTGRGWGGRGSSPPGCRVPPAFAPARPSPHLRPGPDGPTPGAPRPAGSTPRGSVPSPPSAGRPSTLPRRAATDAQGVAAGAEEERGAGCGARVARFAGEIGAAEETRPGLGRESPAQGRGPRPLTGGPAISRPACRRPRAIYHFHPARVG